MTQATLQTTAVAVHPFFDFNDAPEVVTFGHDKDEIRARLLAQLESVLLYLFPHGKRRGSQFFIGNLQGDPGDSLVIELEGPKRGVWIDFATGESGDVLTLWASTRGYTLPVEFNELLEDAGSWLMVPRIAPTPTVRSAVVYDELGPATAKWDYLRRMVSCWPASTAMTRQPASSTVPGMRAHEQCGCRSYARSTTCLPLPLLMP